jgi:hypothetical protein
VLKDFEEAAFQLCLFIEIRGPVPFSMEKPTVAVVGAGESWPNITLHGLHANERRPIRTYYPQKFS